MAKHAEKTRDTEADPFGDMMPPEFVEGSFNEAVEAVYERQRRKGQDSRARLAAGLP